VINTRQLKMEEKMKASAAVLDRMEKKYDNDDYFLN